MVEKKNNMIKEANEEYEYLTGDATVQRIAFLKRKFELDHNSLLYHETKAAEERGEKRGEKRTQEKIAKKMKSKGIDAKIISETTGLSLEEIEKIS